MLFSYAILAAMNPLVTTVIAVAATAVVIGVLAFFLGVTYRKKIAEAEIGSAEQESTRIINEAMKTAENKKKEALLEAKEEIHKNRTEADREIKERRNEVQRQEKRLIQKEETLDKKTEAMEAKNEQLQKSIAETEKVKAEISEIKQKQIALLEELSGLTSEQAKQKLVEQIEGEAKHEAAVRIKAIEDQLKEDAENKAREIISIAIQRCAADHISEAAVSVVPLPSEEMKGRIIGREGRNIRTLETITGVDLIIDDTPEAITLSCFDPVRREIARITLERLISDGRIHPARIEEMAEKARKEVDATIKAEGERAVLETGLHGINPELVKLLGRMKYRTSYGQNVLNHSLEVAHLSGIMAAELGLDVNLAKRGALLHDIGKAVDQEVEGTHMQIGADLAKKYKESKEVVNCIMSHHGDVEPMTVEAIIVAAADAVSGARPGARRESIENYVKRLEKLEEIANSFNGVQKSYAVQAGREIRIIVKPEVVNDETTVLLAKDIAKKIESELEYPGQIKVNVIRELRSVEFAK